MKPMYMRLAKAKRINDELVFNTNKTFGIHIYGTNKDVVDYLNEQGYVVLGSAQMVYVPQDKDENQWL